MGRSKQVRLIREMSGLTLAEAGPMVGLLGSNLCHVEAGRRPISDRLLARVHKSILPLARKRAEALLEEVAISV